MVICLGCLVIFPEALPQQVPPLDVIKFVNDRQQVGGFIRFPPPIKPIASI